MSDWKRVIAIDPGERVGWAIGRMRKGELVIEDQGVTPWFDFCVALWANPGYFPVQGQGEKRLDVCVYETWRLRPDKAKELIGSDMQSSQCVGAVRVWAGYLGMRLQGYGPDRKKVALRSMPDWLKERLRLSSEQHDQDALMHLWMYYFDTYGPEVKEAE